MLSESHKFAHLEVSISTTPISLHKVLISLFVGLLFTSILYGTTIGQAAWYFSVYPKDSEWHLILVGLLLLLDTAHVIVLSVAVYYSILSWLNPLRALNVTAWSLTTSIALTYVLTFVVQCFFLMRIWTLSRKNKTITACIAILATLQMVSGIAVVSKEAGSPLLDITRRTKFATTLELSSSLAADLAITATLVFYLSRGRFATGYAFASNSVINRLMFYAISTGLLTSLVTFINLVLFLAAPNTFYWVVPHVISSKLYVNSLLATLNSRRSVRDLIIRTSRRFPAPPLMSAPRMSTTMKSDIEGESLQIGGGDHGHSQIYALREYDPHVDYDRDLLPPNPHLDPSAHDALQTRRELLSLGFDFGDKTPMVDVCIPSGALSLTPSAFSPGRASLASYTLNINRASRATLVVSPASVGAPRTTWSAHSHSSGCPVSDSSYAQSPYSTPPPSTHSSRLTARTFSTGSPAHASCARNTRPSPSPSASPLSPPPLSPGHALAFVSRSSIAACRNGGVGGSHASVLRIAGINAHARRSGSRSTNSRPSMGIANLGASVASARPGLPIGPTHSSPSRPHWSGRSIASGNPDASVSG